MDAMEDQKTLLADQYMDSSVLDLRKNFHDRFSSNKYGLHRWIFDQFVIPEGGRILELGCGPGHLWLENINRIPSGWIITLADLSKGMIKQIKNNLRDTPLDLRHEVIDAQSIPFDEGSFNTIIANHMLYHIPDRPKAFSEIRRVLRPGGHFYAATNGRSSLPELRELTKQFFPDVYNQPLNRDQDKGFDLQNGREQLSDWFTDIKIHRYEDALIISEVEPLVAYILSLPNYNAVLKKLREQDENLAKEKVEAFFMSVKEKIASEGVIRSEKEVGMFEAKNAGQ